MEKRKRAAAACEFCRRRKLKCDNGQPRCAACNSRDRNCEYVRHNKRPRASRATIEALENENRRLHEAASESRHVSTPSVEQSTVSYQGSLVADSQADHPRQTSDTRIQIDESGQSSYHGPTSALFDIDHAIEIPRISSTSNQAAKDDIRNALVAATAKHRQKECLYSVRQTFDCDGHDPNLVMHLLNIHWNRQHHNLLMVYRPLFMRDMACGGPYFSKMLLNAILFSTAKFSPRADLRSDPGQPSTAGWMLRQRVKGLLGDAMDESTIPTIQALITVASSVFAIGDERSTSWLYSGTAFRMIVDLGLHIDCAELLECGKLSAEDLECRRRVFWGAFVFDKIHSMYQGRPVTLEERDMRVPVEFLDDYEELELWTPVEHLNEAGSIDYPMPQHPGAPTYSVSTFTALCQLSVIMNRIMNRVYSESAHLGHHVHIGDLDVHPIIGPLGHDLVAWLMALNKQLTFEPWRKLPEIASIPNPTILSLHCMYHILTIILHRPFLSRSRLELPRARLQCLSTCFRAASKLSCIVQCYYTAFTVRRAPYFIAYSAFVAATILIRVAAQPPAGALFHDRLNVCLWFLRESERINAGVSKANFVITKLLRKHLLTEPMSTSQEPLLVPFIDVNLEQSEADAIIQGFAQDGDCRDAAPQQNDNDGRSISHRPTLAAKEMVESCAEGTTRAYPQYEEFNDLIFGLHGELLDQWTNLSPDGLSLF